MEQGLLLHMDGARILNASVSCGFSPMELVKYCDSSTFCLNKGLGAPMGSILVGTKEYIERAQRIRTMLGGTMHQAGIFAAAALYALKNVAPKLHWDHANARAIAQGKTICNYTLLITYSSLNEILNNIRSLLKLDSYVYFITFKRQFKI